VKLGLVAVFAGFLFLSGCKGLAYRPATNAMAPTLTTKDMCVANPFAYDERHPIQRFDIVVYQEPDEVKRRTNQEGDVRILKRIIGMPGDKLEIRQNALYINDQLVDEPFEKIVSENDPKKNYGPIVIGSDLHFIAGDNRPDSLDSRYNEHGLVKKEAIISKITDIKKEFYKD
jgi:signal peptidase I